MCDFDDFFDDLEVEDFAFTGGAIGFVEEELEEERILDRINEGLDPDEDGAP